MEKKYGVSLSQLKQLKEFQLSLLRNRKKTLPSVMNVIGSITTTIQNNVENHLVKQQFIARLSVGNGIILIEPTEGHTISPKLRDIVCVNVIGNDVIIEFRPYLFFDKCTFHLDETQRQNFLASLPPIHRPDDGHVDTDNSSEESELNDSVAGRTQLGITTSDREGSDEGR